MTLLESQSAIKSRRATVRDTSGQFIRPDRALEIRKAAERMKSRLRLDVKAKEHADGLVYERRHFHKLPNAAKPLEGPGVEKDERVLL